MATIKAGTYRFNDEVSWLGEDTINHPHIYFNFKCVYRYNEDTLITLTCSAISIHNIRKTVDGVEYRIPLILYRAESAEPSLDYSYPQWFTVHNDNPVPTGTWNELSRNITVTEDFEADENTSSWFTENTTMLIQAGTYMWNDTLTEAENVNTFEFVSNDITFAVLAANFPNPNDPSLFAMSYYTSGDEEHIAYINTNVTGLIGWQDIKYRIITITEDTYVPTNFGLWANENWKTYSEETKKLTNLTHSTWEFDCANINIDISEYFYINGTLSAGGYSATSALDGVFELKKDWCLTFPNHDSITPRFYCNVSGDPYLRYFATDGTNFTVDTKCTLYISSGADVTNEKLIEWLYANAKLKSKTISGVWKFKEAINLVDNLGASFDFTNHIQPYQTYGDEVDKVMTYKAIDVSSSGITYHIRQYDIAGEYGSSYQVYSVNASGWQNDAYRLLILVGTVAVPDDFYDWFTANAVNITDDVAQVIYNGRLIGAVEDGKQIKLSCTGDIMIIDVKVIAPKTERTIVPNAPNSTTPILKGVWRFKETITATQGVSADTNCKIVGYYHGIYLYINKISVSVGNNGNVGVSYSFQGEDGIITTSSYYTSNNGWTSEMYRYIYFPTELTVNQAFYDWFITNAEDISNSVTYIKLQEEIIGILKSGMTATLPCKDSTVKDRIIITARKTA